MKKVRKGPLKKVIREFWKDDIIGGITLTRLFEELECGHIQRKPKDFYGEYDSNKRRCTYCNDRKEDKE